METFDIILIAAGAFLLFSKGNFNLSEWIQKGKDLLAKSESSKPLEVKKDELALPPVKVEIPLDARQKIDWYEVRSRLQDGVQFVDIIFFARILLTLLQFIRPFLMQTANEEIAKIESQVKG